jgi:serine/threonine protein kinase
MGEVYRARDTKLGRDVALKVLAASVAVDLDRLARLEREARLLASLNHPNIAAIYGVEESGGVTALVLELVEGETLARKLARVSQSSGGGRIQASGCRSPRRWPLPDRSRMRWTSPTSAGSSIAI